MCTQLNNDNARTKKTETFAPVNQFICLLVQTMLETYLHRHTDINGDTGPSCTAKSTGSIVLAEKRGFGIVSSSVREGLHSSGDRIMKGFCWRPKSSSCHGKFAKYPTWPNSQTRAPVWPSAAHRGRTVWRSGVALCTLHPGPASDLFWSLSEGKCGGQMAKAYFRCCVLN